MTSTDLASLALRYVMQGADVDTACRAARLVMQSGDAALGVALWRVRAGDERWLRVANVLRLDALRGAEVLA